LSFAIHITLINLNETNNNLSTFNSMKFFAPIYIIASFNRSAGFEGLPQKESCHLIKKKIVFQLTEVFTINKKKHFLNISP